MANNCALSPFLQQGLPGSMALGQQVWVGFETMFSLCSFPFVSAELCFQHPSVPLALEVQNGHLCCVTTAASLFPPHLHLWREISFPGAPAGEE